MELAHAENTAALQPLGISVPDDSDSDEPDSSIEDDGESFNSDSASGSDDEIVGSSSAKPIQPDFASTYNCDTVNTTTDNEAVGMHQESGISDSSTTGASQPDFGSIDCDMMNKTKDATQSMTFSPSCDHMLLILRGNHLNWFSFIEDLKTVTRGFTQESFNQLLIDFAFYISSSDVTEEEEKLIEESRQAFVATERQRIAQQPVESIESDDENDAVSPDDWLNVTSLDSKAAQEIILKHRKIYRRKSRARAAKVVAEARLLRRKLPNRVSKILKEHPSICHDIEEFVKEHKVGADAWRRTGVLTFTYANKSNVNTGRKMTYSRIKEYLETKYNHKISYGTVVQLCVTRNHRRIYSKRYKGVAQVTCRKARKGFSVKFNPDAHYSTAMYRGLDHHELRNGQSTLILNRDDAAGFRLDSTFSHKQHKLLCIVNEPELTTRSDYLNKYTALLQVSSYMFMSTDNTKEVCCGVVKAHGNFEKSPAQHAADLYMLEEQPELKSIF